MNHNTVITFSNRLQLYSKFLQHETACTACRMCKKYFRAAEVTYRIIELYVLEYTNNTGSGVIFLESSFTKFSTSYNRMSHDKQSTCAMHVLHPTCKIAELIITVYLVKRNKGTLRITHRSQKFRIIISWLIYREISVRKFCLPIF